MGLSTPIALKAAFFHEVTMFQAILPSVRWSNVENRLARRNGGSKLVDAVMPKVRFFVTAAIAEIGYERSIATHMRIDALLTIDGSVIGH